MSEDYSRQCSKIARLLPDYEVGIGSAETRSEVERHLGVCPDCARELQALRRTAALLESTGAEAAPDSWDSIRSQLEPRPAPSVRQGFFPWMVRHKLQTAAAAVAAGIALGVVVLTGGNPPEVDTQTFFANHATMSWSDPFADKAILGLVSAVPAQKNVEAAP